MKNFKTTDIALAAYLRAKGFPLLETELSNGRMVEFSFSPETEKIAKDWQFNPSPEMTLIKDFVTERESLFRLVKESRDYGQTYR